MAKIPEDVLEFFRKQGARGGKKGHAARMEKLTPEQRSVIAKKAAAASAKVRSARAKKKTAVAKKA